jgi:hypothetical protein
MSLLDFTTYEDIRAALGVNDAELSDDTLALSLYSNNLAAELDDLSLTLVATYRAAADLPEDDRTDAQRRLVSNVQLFSTYTVAKQLSGSLPMFAPKSVSDSKAEISRFADPYRDTVKQIKTQWELYRQRTVAAFAAASSSSVTSVARTVMLVAEPTTDAVTTS